LRSCDETVRMSLEGEDLRHAVELLMVFELRERHPR
jgi:hypothetical protein